MPVDNPFGGKPPLEVPKPDIHIELTSTTIPEKPKEPKPGDNLKEEVEWRDGKPFRKK